MEPQTTENLQSSPPARSENEFLGYVFKPDGRKEVRWQGGKEVEVSLPDEILQGMPSGIRKKHLDFLAVFEGIVEQAVAAKRSVSILQEELLKISGVTKHLINECERWGLLETKMVELKGKGRHMGGHKAVVFSPQGRALMKHLGDAMAEMIKESQVAGSK